MVGYGGAAAYGGNQPRRPGRLMVFKLGGKTVPAPFAPVTVPGPLDLTDAVPSAGKANAGLALFGRLCSGCHRTGDFVPNLGRSPMILRPDSFSTVVLGGALKANGMASFKRYLTPAQAEDIRAWLLDEAKAVQGRAPTPGSAAGDHAQ
jgi:mono/diheme cytochrome c family protein